jgi:hypothetical protein
MGYDLSLGMEKLNIGQSNEGRRGGRNDFQFLVFSFLPFWSFETHERTSALVLKVGRMPFQIANQKLKTEN